MPKTWSEWSFAQFLYCNSILQVAVSVGTMQLTFSIAIMQVPKSVAIMQVWGSVAIMMVILFATVTLVDLSVEIMQLKVSSANIWVTIFYWNYASGGSLLQLCRLYFLLCIIHMTISVVIMHVTVSVAAMYVTVSSSNFIFLFLTDTYFS